MMTKTSMIPFVFVAVFSFSLESLALSSGKPSRFAGT